MKKFIISFTFKGFSFSAKVTLHKTGGAILYSVVLLENCLNSLLDGDCITFIEEHNGFRLLLLHDNVENEILDWKIKNEIVDNSKVVDPDVFSLS